MAKDAYRFVVPLIIIAGLLAWLGLYVPALALGLLAAFVIFFFRSPRRVIPQEPNLVVSPADGRIVRIADADPGEGEPDSIAISIFLSVFNVHVNRSPIAGCLAGLQYRRGGFEAAYKDSASRHNEQNILIIQGDSVRVIVKQIAGLIARRVVCWKAEGTMLSRGELFGLIRFGSRVDLILPRRTTLRVRIGDRVRGGSSVIGEMQ